MFEKGYSRFASERGLDIEHNCNILTPKLMAINVVSFPFFRAAQPEAQGPLCWVLTFFTAYYQHFLWTSIYQGPKPHRPGVAFTTISRPQLPTQQARRTQLSYIIIRRPLDLWNRRFNRHQAKITVMQFRGHSLPVHQSMSVSWDFLACPILLANVRRRDFLS